MMLGRPALWRPEERSDARSNSHGCQTGHINAGAGEPAGLVDVPAAVGPNTRHKPAETNQCSCGPASRGELRRQATRSFCTSANTNGSAAFANVWCTPASEGSNIRSGPMRHFITIAAVLSTGIALAQTPNGQPPGAGARSGAESIQPRLNLTAAETSCQSRPERGTLSERGR